MCKRTKRRFSNFLSTLLHSMHLKPIESEFVPTFLPVLCVDLVQDLISNQEQVISG
ncbi:hypothetical protein Hanom_Chr15g01388471 [Helianthus anomalus]